MNFAFPFSARVACCGWILLDPRCGGAIGQLSPFRPGVFPQSLYCFDDVRDGDDEHDDGDRKAKAMECGWHRERRENSCQYYRGSIRVDQKTLWVVARTKKTPRQRQAHGAGQPRYICLPSLEFRSAHPMLRSFHSTLARRGETGAPLFVSSLFFCHAHEQIKPRVPALPVAPKATQSNGLRFSGSWISLERHDRRWSTAHPYSSPWTLYGSRCDGRPISLSLWNR
jgi:hypothetical protein